MALNDWMRNTQLTMGGSVPFAQQNYGAPTQQPYTGNNQSPSGMTTGGSLSTGATQPTQTTQPTQGLIAGTQQQAYADQERSAAASQARNPVEQAGYQTVDPILRQVQDNELSQNQLYSMLDKNSPLITRARERALMGMQGSGLLNSSMAMGAAEGAAWDAAEPFALQDAQAYGKAASENQEWGNRGQEFNAGAFNKNQEFNVGARNERGNINVNNDAQLDRTKITEAGQMDRLNISEAGDTARQNSVNDTSIKTTGMNNATTLQATKMTNDTSLATTKMSNDTSITTTGMNNSTQRETANISANAIMRNADVAASTALQQSQISASTQRDVAEYNGELARVRDQDRMVFDAGQNSLTRITNILTDPNMTPGYRDEAIQQITQGAQRTASYSGAVNNLELALA